MNRTEILTGVLLFLLGAAMSMGICVLISAHQPVQNRKCNDGWQIEERDGEIIKTYVEETDTCQKK